MLGSNTLGGVCTLENGKQGKAGRPRPERTTVRQGLQPKLHSEQIVILRIIGTGMSFLQIRRYMFEIEASETRPSETSHMITHLIEAGFAEAVGGLVRLTRKGSIAVAAYG